MNLLTSKIFCYTRKPTKDYTESLSNSIHFAYCGADGTDFEPLNRNYGILFAKATIDEQDVIQEKGLKYPYIFSGPTGSFGIIAVRVTKEGKNDAESRGEILLWTSEDFITFKYHGLLELHKDLYVNKAICEYNAEKGSYDIRWLGSDGQYYKNTLECLTQPERISYPVRTEAFTIDASETTLTDIFPGNVLSVEKAVGEAFKVYWTPLFNTEIRLPNHVKLTSSKQLEEIKAIAVYSDGSTADKQVIWDANFIDFSRPGTYTIKGRVTQAKYQFPLAVGYADPVILPWNDKYYYVATNDNMDDVGIYVREADTIEGLFAPEFKEALILDLQEEKGFIQTFWAPEFHKIGNDLYILFAVSGRIWGPQCHMMKLKKGGNILNPADWEEPIRVRRKDGTYLAEEGITLDMTYFKADGVSCVVWSYRNGINSPLDTGSMLYIATVDETNPTILTSEPLLLTRPLYGWENIQGTINNEGPYPLITEDTVYLTYSGGAACGYTYALGLLSIPRGSDYLDVDAWRKSSTPVLSYYSIEGVYGPGHNSFFRDYDGNTMIMYHGERELVPFGTRCTTMHRVHFNQQGLPIFDMAGERDLNSALAEVAIEVVVE